MRLNSFRLSQSVTEIVYKPLIKSVLIFFLTSWFGHDFRLMSKLVTIVTIAGKITGKPQARLRLRVMSILIDGSHPLFPQVDC